MGLVEEGYTLLSPHDVNVQGVVAESLLLLHPLPRRKSFMGSLVVTPAMVAAVHAVNLSPYLEAYFGHTPSLTSIELFRSTPQSAPYRSGQLWHLDIDYPKQLKWFVMCRPMTHANGPFTFLSAPHSQQVQQATGYVPGKSLLDTQINVSPTIEVVGEPGVSVLVDTSRCLHFGSRVHTGERIALVVQFV